MYLAPARLSCILTRIAKLLSLLLKVTLAFLLEDHGARSLSWFAFRGVFRRLRDALRRSWEVRPDTPTITQCGHACG